MALRGYGSSGNSWAQGLEYEGNGAVDTDTVQEGQRHIGSNALSVYGAVFHNWDTPFQNPLVPQSSLMKLESMDEKVVFVITLLAGLMNGPNDTAWYWAHTLDVGRVVDIQGKA